MDLKASAGRLVEILRLKSEPVAVYLDRPDSPLPASPEFRNVARHHYCQLLMRARQGEAVMISPEELACPAAAAAFGFQALPENLANGKGRISGVTSRTDPRLFGIPGKKCRRPLKGKGGVDESHQEGEFS